MVVFYPSFIDPTNATHIRVADHIEYIASVCGKKHVGLGSDFDGMRSSVEGLEDASKFPNLVRIVSLSRLDEMLTTCLCRLQSCCDEAGRKTT